MTLKQHEMCHEKDTVATQIRYGVYTAFFSVELRGQLCFRKFVLFFRVPATTSKVWRMLLVDDDPLVSESIRRMLEFDQRHVCSVGSAAEALAVCEGENFDIVILDYLMPVMKGDELAARLKHRYPNLPIIMITADAEKLDASAPLPDGVDVIMGKPFRFDELRGAINRMVLKR